MNIAYTASEILRGKWFIEPMYAESHGPIIAGLLNRQLDVETPKEDKLAAYAVPMGAQPVGKYSLKYESDSIPENSVAVIPLRGSLMKYNQECGPMGMAEIGELVKKADAHPNINKIVFQIDSPGGTVDGTEALGQIIKDCKTRTVAFVDGLMCSAAIWLGSCCNEIVASTDTDQVGSVGVLLSFMDVQPYWEKLGITFHTITASTSPDKATRWEKLRAGKYDEYKKEVLDPLDEKFMNIIRENRPNVKDEHLTGKVYFARDVMGVFVDSIGTLDQILSESIGNAPSGNAPAINTKKDKSMKKLPFLVALFAAASIQLEADADGGVYMNEEQLEAVNAILEKQGSADDLAKERDNALTAQQNAEGSLATANERIAQLEKELDNKPGAESATAIKATDATKTVEKSDDEFAALADASELYKSIKQ